MTSVFKYALKIKELQTISMPQGAVPLTVQMQRETPCLWARVDPDLANEPVSIRIAGTGHPLYNVGAYIGTFQDGPLVFHVFLGTPGSY